MNSGKYIFTQIADLIKMTPFRKLVKKYRGDYRAHDLTCYNQFLHLLFGQLSSCTSLRDICLCLKAHESSLFHMGFGNTVDHTTLSRANEKRDYHIHEEMGCFLIKTDCRMERNHLWEEVSSTMNAQLSGATWNLKKYMAKRKRAFLMLFFQPACSFFITITSVISVSPSCPRAEINERKRLYLAF